MQTIMYLIVPITVLALCVGYRIGYNSALRWTIKLFKGKKNAKP